MKNSFDSRGFALSLSVALSLTVAGCAHSGKKDAASTGAIQTPARIPTLVFIQGVHLDAISWSAVTARIDRSAFAVMDLGRMGRDTAEPATLKNIATLGCMAIPDHSILVGHSYGGAISNEMFGLCPDKITKIIYVTAVVPIQGEKPFDRLSKGGNDRYAKAVEFKAPKIVPRKPHPFFKVTDAQVKRSRMPAVLYPEWMSLTSEKIEFDAQRFAAVPKAYIYTSKDTVVTPETQKFYVERLAITQTASVPTGHFPMFSATEQLAEEISKFAR